MPKLMPNLVDILFSDLRFLPRVGPKLAPILSKLVGGSRVIDLLYHFPVSFIKKKYLPPLTSVRDKDFIITKVVVESHSKSRNRSGPFKIRCFSKSGYLTVVLFKIFPNYVERNFAVGSEIVLSGKVNCLETGIQMVHPDYVLPAKLIDIIPKIDPIYPLCSGVSSRFLSGRINEVLTRLKNFKQSSYQQSKNRESPQYHDSHEFVEWTEWIDINLIKKESWPSWPDAILNLHKPEPLTDFIFDNPSRRRLAYDELFAAQITALLVQQKNNQEDGRISAGTGLIRQQLLQILPFELTAGQKRVLAEIDADMASGYKMLRLLQGDVGSGKTIVALLAAISVIELKRQAVLIVPISLLAGQHFANFSKLIQGLGINIGVLTSKTTKKQKAAILTQLKNGEIDLIIGTHALVCNDIIFKDLALIIIDEQHRFGVLQRMELVKKGIKPDVLLMSATPIPRTMMMTLYNDMSISILDQKPINRQLIDTRIISQQRIEEVYAAISRALENGEKIYWICPLIDDQDYGEVSAEESTSFQEDNPCSNVQNRYQEFVQKFSASRVALIHGKMKEKDKDQIMQEFSSPNGLLQLLVATTVIEVGIDVVDATIIVIENCEKFGLSQLHQLRGRVGRGNKKSYCILIYGQQISKNGKTRLQIMKHSNDGFKIAEEDLKIRGFGERFGTRQSGLPEYKIANLALDIDLLNIANRNAKLLFHKDPNLSGKSALGVKTLLKIFNNIDSKEWGI